MPRFLACLALILSLAGVASAQDQGRTIIVFDASGSMWGQIDGKAKITIAQSVMGDLLASLPADQQLGLTAYGHRRKGDCSDIETLVEPGPDTRAAIAAAVNAIKPKGKTPLSDAVIAAAKALHYTEDKATVILISDGIETCERDPCAVGRALEQAGVDFTAHVIGFDVAERDALAQLQCLAENTGGTFRTARNAEELSEALKATAAPPPPPPAPTPRKITFLAIEGDNGPVISEGLIWSLTNTDTGEMVLDSAAQPRVDIELLPGTYRAEVLRAENESTADAMITVNRNTDTTIELVLPLLLPSASLSAPPQGVAGDVVLVTWEGPDNESDFITVTRPDQRDGEWINYTYTRHGSPLDLVLPAEPGTYEIRYVLNKRSLVLAKSVIEVTAISATLDAVESANSGDTIQVDWTGPDYDRDYIAVARPDDPAGKYTNYTYSRHGSPGELQMPSEPGEYELRYIMNQDNTILARRPITVLDVSATLDAAAEAPAGSILPVTWTGPDYDRDFIAVARRDAPANKYTNYTYSRHGSPGELQMPAEAGEYELRYIMNEGNRILARQPITITAIGATLDAAADAPIGATVAVTWTGPDYDRDFIAVAEPDAKPGKYLHYAYARHGSPASVKMPAEPGDYELRYIQNQGQKILARRMITVVDQSAEMSAATEANVGQMLEVTWTGPDYDRDIIALAEVGAKPGKFLSYAYSRHGSPLSVQMPAEPGNYELRYLMKANPLKILASIPVTLLPVTASLEAPASAAGGSTIIVDWQGPDYPRDLIAIAPKGASRFATYAYARHGSPAEIKLPEEPGEYEIWYVMNQGNTVLTRRSLIVE